MLVINKTKYLLSMLALAMVWSFAHADTRSDDHTIVYQDHPQFEALFAQAEYKKDFWASIRYFVTQKTVTFCGIASSVVVLNSLEVPAPLNPAIYPYRLFDQNTLFSADVLSIVTPNIVSAQGISLHQLGQLLATYAVDTKVVYASDSSVEQFRDQVIDALNRSDQRVVINFHRSILNQEGAGHISPVVAYNEAADMFLVLDVARYKLPSYWVKTTLLFDSLSGNDSASEKTRGYIIVSK